MDEMQRTAKDLFRALLDLTVLVESFTALEPRHLNRAALESVQRRLRTAAVESKALMSVRAASIGINPHDLPWGD